MVPHLLNLFKSKYHQYYDPSGTPMGPELCKTLEIHLECMRVCVCMCGIALLKAKTFKAFAIYFSVY